MVDDGSTDDTDALMAEYMARDSRIQYHHRPDHHKPGGNGARNYGLEQSRGVFINFLDSDDMFHPEAMALKTKFAVKNNSDILISKNCRNKNELNPQATHIKTFYSDSFDIDFILSRNSILIGEPLIRFGALEDLRFDEDLVRSQDYDFLLRLFRKKLKFCSIDAVLYYYRKNPKSISRKASLGSAKESRTQLAVIKRNLIYYHGNESVEIESKRAIRKMYIALMKKKRIDRILENFDVYRQGFNLSYLKFGAFFIINILTGKGFDRMRKNIK